MHIYIFIIVTATVVESPPNIFHPLLIEQQVAHMNLFGWLTLDQLESGRVSSSRPFRR